MNDIAIQARCVICTERLTWPLDDYQINGSGRAVHRSCQAALEADITHRQHTNVLRAQRVRAKGRAT
jgi:hypothetical protein